MENAILKDFIAYSNNLVKEWMDNPEEKCKSDLFFRPVFSMTGMPEPYLGNPCCSSAVIIDINPGKENSFNSMNGTEPQNFINQYLVSGSYEGYAEEFPYLNDYMKDCGYEFWNSRIKWINRLCGVDEKSESPLPFALELCPWHSESWPGMHHMDDDMKNHIRQRVIEPACEAIRYSKLKFGLIIGKEICDIFRKVDSDWTWLGWNNAHRNFEKDFTMPGKGRKYALLKKDSVCFLCTWASYNNPPAKEFYEKEEMLICDIIKSKYLMNK